MKKQRPKRLPGVAEPRQRPPQGRNAWPRVDRDPAVLLFKDLFRRFVQRP